MEVLELGGGGEKTGVGGGEGEQGRRKRGRRAVLEEVPRRGSVSGWDDVQSTDSTVAQVEEQAERMRSAGRKR